MSLLSPEQEKAFVLQGKEFDAMAGLADAWRALTLTAVVEDDYPLMRGRYERASQVYADARAANHAYANNQKPK